MIGRRLLEFGDRIVAQVKITVAVEIKAVIALADPAAFIHGKIKEQAGVCFVRPPAETNRAKNRHLGDERGMVFDFWKRLVLAPAHLSPDEVVLAWIKDRDFTQLEGLVLVGFTRAQDS